ncbi:SHOCT domain-containing protein [Rhodococcus chondri]|uniref:SHOCT domain-containing protein n=1 Tax=Rhodococcus chondri TaxID=3065941 RepID=A0ABU7JQY0_9NOCA|nr:SHOCT domain-containing protein [Rhodococcus sp. CC-R104]MEE2031904.1 SHOCT domain-containing protein [Rhodococcus sp. CC-R104]
MMGWAWGSSWAVWTVMAVCMLAFWVVVLYLVAVLFRTDRARATGSTDDSSDPLRLLEARFARGEIEADEFAARRQLLTQTPGTTEAPDRRGRAHG